MAVPGDGMLTSGGKRLGMLLDVVQCTGQMPTTKNYLEMSLMPRLRDPGRWTHEPWSTERERIKHCTSIIFY